MTLTLTLALALALALTLTLALTLALNPTPYWRLNPVLHAPFPSQYMERKKQKNRSLHLTGTVYWF